MEIYKEDIVDIELENGTIHRTFQNKAIGEGDKNGNRFGFRCLRNGVPINMNGTNVLGHFMRADGVTIEIDGGTVTGDTAFITLPEGCYAVEGQFELAIKLNRGEVTGTIRIIDGTVVNTTNGDVIDPGNVIPDLSDYLAAIDEAVEAAETIRGTSIEAVNIDGDDYEIIITTGE